MSTIKKVGKLDKAYWSHYMLKQPVKLPNIKTVIEMEVGDTYGFNGNGKHWTIKRDE